MIKIWYWLMYIICEITQHNYQDWKKQGMVYAGTQPEPYVFECTRCHKIYVVR